MSTNWYHKKERTPMVAIPRKMQPSCFMASLGSVSLINSGKTETRAENNNALDKYKTSYWKSLPILRKPPAENGKIQEVLASRDWTESRDKAAMAPSMPTLAVHIWAFPASHLKSNVFNLFVNFLFQDKVYGSNAWFKSTWKIHFWAVLQNLQSHVESRGPK